MHHLFFLLVIFSHIFSSSLLIIALSHLTLPYTLPYLRLQEDPKAASATPLPGPSERERRTDDELLVRPND